MKYMLLIASDPTTWTDDPAEGDRMSGVGRRRSDDVEHRPGIAATVHRCARCVCACRHHGVAR